MLTNEGSESARDNFGRSIHQFQPETKTLIWKLKRILIKLYRQNVFLLFNETCLNERLLPNYTHTHTHTHTHTLSHIYTYMGKWKYMWQYENVQIWKNKAFWGSSAKVLVFFSYLYIFIYIYIYIYIYEDVQVWKKNQRMYINNSNCDS